MERPPAICQVHGTEPDPKTDPGGAIEWLELHYGDKPYSRVCRRKAPAALVAPREA